MKKIYKKLITIFGVVAGIEAFFRLYPAFGGKVTDEDRESYNAFLEAQIDVVNDYSEKRLAEVEIVLTPEKADKENAKPVIAKRTICAEPSADMSVFTLFAGPMMILIMPHMGKQAVKKDIMLISR